MLGGTSVKRGSMTMRQSFACAVASVALISRAGEAGGGFSSTGPQRHAVIGGEAQWYWSQFTLYAQVGYDSTLGNIGSSTKDSIHAWFIRGTGRYFVNPNFLLEGTVMY